MQRRIQTLPPQLANQIAAGEVVERPASVVKELLENSIDAGAEQVELEVEQGGARLIRVVDNGRGIHHDDLALALSPHATSKIYSQSELEQIGSLGFRGEALASIASVSRFKLASKQEEAGQGWELEGDGTKVNEPVPSPLPGGTLVEVRDLFYNTPARRKFLRSERTEFLHIEEVLKRLALSRFDIAFTLRHNGRQHYRLRRAVGEAQQARRIADVFGRGFIQTAVSLHFEAAGMRLSGWLAMPEGSRSQADSQYFYLNGRMIRDKLINHAVRQAHQAVLAPGRHPAYVLYMEVDPAQVDVNVHPTKHEVRFRESRLVHDFVVRALQNALAGVPAASEVEESHSGVENPLMRTDSGYDTNRGAITRRASGQVAEQRSFYQQASDISSQAAQGLGTARAILHQAYLLIETGSAPLLLELDAARRYLLRQHLAKMLEADEVRSQPLLIPQTVNLSQKHVDILLEGSHLYASLGFEIERLGEEAVVLRRVPVMLHGVEAASLLNELVVQLQRTGSDVEEKSEALQAALVDRAVSASPVTDMEEANRILRQVEALPDQGRDFWCPLTLEQLQQWFSRNSRG